MKASLSRDRMHLGSHVVLIFWTFLVLFPLWTMIVNSFKFKFDIYTDPFGLPKKWNFESYVSVITDGDFFLYFRNSLFVTLGSIFLVLLFGAMASYALVNWKHKASRFLYLFFIAGMMLPIKIGSIRLLQLIKGLGLLNTLWGLFPVYTAMGLPIAVFVLTEFIRPLLRPALATVAIYNLIPFWNDLWFPLIFINQDAHKTLLLGVTRLFGQYMTDWSRILAVLTLSAIPVLVLYLTMSKNFIRGLTAGAVKG